MSSVEQNQEYDWIVPAICVFNKYLYVKCVKCGNYTVIIIKGKGQFVCR